MPGRHAPASSRSFLVSLGTAVGGAVIALGVVVGIALVALNAGTSKPEAAPTTTPPTTTAFTTSPSPSVSPSAAESPGVVPVAETKIRILNGSGRPGQAASMAERARKEGYKDPAVGNTSHTAKSTVYYRADSRAAAERFQRQFPEFTEIAAAPSSFANDVHLTIVIGLDYPASSSSPSASPSPSASR